MHLLRLVCCMDSDELCSMGGPVDVVRSDLGAPENTEADRAGEEADTGWNVAIARDLGVGEQCSRVEPVGGGEEEDPVACGGDGATYKAKVS